tara:strand:- start:19 stop:327 length:309 start_codon:yes stop_codon:yes gene_type:complete
MEKAMTKDPDDFSLESRQTLLELTSRIQEEWWMTYNFKFQRGWIAASLFSEDFEINNAISLARRIVFAKDPKESDELFDKCWQTYLTYLSSIKEKEDEDEDE